jgi:hypothetical protein
MTAAPRFTVSREAAELAASSLDSEFVVPATEPVAEGDRLNMRLSGREAAQEYQIRIGNLPPDAPHGFEPGRDPAFGYDLGAEIVWPSAAYVESARGPTIVELRSRSPA